MKKKLFSLLALTLAGGFVFASCQNFEDLVPEEYGAWENYYIYRGNVRSKTTGEAPEKLVTSVEKDETDYNVVNCIDYAIAGDHIYMCLYLENTSAMEFKNAIVCYDVKEKTQEPLVFDLAVDLGEELGVWTYEPYTIEHIFEEEEKLLVNGSRRKTTVDEYGIENTEYQSLYYCVSFDGTILEAESYNYTGYTHVSDDYFMRASGGENGSTIYEYITWDMENPTVFYEYIPTATTYSKVEFVERNGVKGFLITEYEKEETTEYLTAVKFYDVTKGNTESLFTGKSLVKWIETPKYEYFMTYEVGEVTYTYKDGLFESASEATTTLNENCVLYKIDYAQSGVTLKKAHTFDEGKDFTYFQGVAGDEFYAQAIWYENAGGCKGGGAFRQAYILNLKSGKLEKIKDEKFREARDICYGYYAIESGVSCGDYSYYIQRVELTSIGNSKNWAYMLKRYHSSEDKTDVMQLWKSGSSHEEEKYCQEMWKQTGGDINDFIVRNY